MHPHYRQHHRSLYPAQHTLLIIRIFVLVSGAEESACVIGPPRLSGRHHAQASYYLPPQCLPVISYISAPGHGAISLHSGSGTAGEYKRFFVRSCLAQSFICGLDDFEGIYIPVEFSREIVLSHRSSREVVILRFRSIQPPCIDAQAHELLLEILPVICRRVSIEEIDPVRAVDIVSQGIHPVTQFAGTVNLGPHGEHQFHVHSVEAVHKCLRVRIILGVELHGVPSGPAPPLPVLDYDVNGYALLPEGPGVFKQVGGRDIALAAMYITEGGVRYARSLAGKSSECAYYLVGTSAEYGVVESGSYRRAEFGIPPVEPPSYRRTVTPGPAHDYAVRSSRQIHLHRSGRRQPGIVQVGDHLSVYFHIELSGHFLADIQQQGIPSVLRGCKLAFKSLEHTPFPYVAVSACRIYVYGFTIAVFCTFQLHHLLGRVEIGQTVIVPEYAISFIGYDNGDGYLCVDLREPPGEAADVEVSVLELPQAELMVLFLPLESLGYGDRGDFSDPGLPDFPAAFAFAEQRISVPVKETEPAVCLVADRTDLLLDDGHGLLVLDYPETWSCAFFGVIEFFRFIGLRSGNTDSHAVVCQRGYADGTRCGPYIHGPASAAA